MFSLLESPFSFYNPFCVRRSLIPRRRIVRPYYYAYDLCNEYSDEEDQPKKETFGIQTKTFIQRKDGIELVRKETIDEVKGTKIYYEKRQIGDKSLTVKTETDKDGKVDEEQILENLEESEIEAFKEDWTNRTEKKSIESPKEEIPKIE